MLSRANSNSKLSVKDMLKKEDMLIAQYGTRNFRRGKFHREKFRSKLKKLFHSKYNKKLGNFCTSGFSKLNLTGSPLFTACSNNGMT